MNSMSKCNCHEEKEVCCKKEKEVCCKGEGTHVVLKCGCPSSRALPVIAVAALGLPGSSFTVATLTVNTEDFCDPCIKFEFASNIALTVAAVPLGIDFQIFKQCKNQFAPTAIGPVYTFAAPIGALASTTFSFFVCDCDICSDECCTYSVVVTPTLAVGVGNFINNATLSALVVEGDRC